MSEVTKPVKEMWTEENDQGGIDLCVKHMDGTGVRLVNACPVSIETRIEHPSSVTESSTFEFDNVDVRDNDLREWIKQVIGDDREK